MPTRALLALLAFVHCWLPSAAWADDGEFFQEQVSPIFERRCVQCHQGATAKGKLSLETDAAALAGGESGAALVPGKPDESLLVQMIEGDEPLMPKGAEPLSADEVAAVRDWIAGGAAWPEGLALVDKRFEGQTWWSLKPLAKPDVPAASDWARTPIDAFINEKLSEQGLAPSPEAGPRTLIRRLYFDLHGLPPTPEEVREFLADTAPDAYERLVDRLLASPRYGERWARHWLDVVHFGETHGYDKDQPRPNAWPYRDYVIRAFNEDKPYSQFVREQVAGDVLYPGTRDGREALGFISAGPWDLIGHAEVPETKIDGQIARHLDRDDMVSTTINTFCSLTVHCAQCHNHKFDPIPQADYYSLQAVFAAVDRTDLRYDLDQEIARQRATIEARRGELQARQAEVAERIKAAAGPRLAELEQAIVSEEQAASGSRRPEYGWHSMIAATQDVTKWVQVDLGQSVTIDRVALAPCWDDFNSIGPGFGFPVRFRIEAADDAEFQGSVQVIATEDAADFANPGTALQTYPAEGKSARYVRVTASKLAPRQNDFIFSLAELQVFDQAGQNVAAGAEVTALDSIEAPVRWSHKNLTDGIYPASSTGERLPELRHERDELLASVPQELLQEQTELTAAIQTAQAEWGALPPQQVVYAGTVHNGQGNFVGTGAKGGRPRPIHILPRGDVLKPGAECGPGALSCVTALAARFDLPAEAPEGARRAALADWLASRDNAFVWRSIVNRVWLYHFGRGLVETPNDFGRMGGSPSHPELLDWLAVTFRDDLASSFKQLHRLLVTSAVYRQSSAFNDAAATVDAENTLLWRMKRRKLEAEAVRDSILAVAGKLDLSMGGPSFQDFVVQHPEHSPHYMYDLADLEDPKLHRRAVYRFLVRSQQQPFMTALDCADPSMLVEKRNQTITPLQALTQLNNQLVLVMARHFADRVQREAGDDAQQQAERALWLACSRPATAEETALLADHIRRHGLAQTCRLLLNLNEFTFVD